MSEEMAFELAQQLNILHSQPARNPAQAAQGRAAFLAQAAAMANSLPLPVTESEPPRHIRWMHPLRSIFTLPRKEQTSMVGALSTILLIVSLILGGGGVTVAAAQTSLPDQLLYPVKTWSEDARVQMSRTTQTRLDLALAYSQRRAEELQAMVNAGQVPPDTIQARLQAEIDLALRLAAGQPDGAALKALAQIRARLQAQMALFAEAGLSPNAPGAGLLERTRVMLHDRLQLCDLGLQDPAALRDQLRERDRLHDGPFAPTAQPPSGAGTMGSGHPWPTGTPTPGSGYGPGPGAGHPNGANNPWTTGTPTPESGYGPGPGTGAGADSGGSRPWITGTPTPGASDGPGPRNREGIGTGSGGSDTGGTGGAGTGAGSGGANTGGAGTGAGGGGTSGSGGSGGTSGSGSCDGSGNGGAGAGTGGQGAGGHGEGGPGGHH